MTIRITEDIIGQRFGRLVVLEKTRRNTKLRVWYYKCKCDCGKEKEILKQSLVRGQTVSCGCYAKELNRNKKTIHGNYKSHTYRSWDKMIQRCTNKKTAEYIHYGGRGIKVCERWKDYANFLEDMGEKPSNKHSIDRINVDGNYDLNNCRWATSKEQANNTRRNVKFFYKGKSKTISELADMAGLRYDTMYYRLMIYKWDIDNAMIKPASKSNSRKNY